MVTAQNTPDVVILMRPYSALNQTKQEYQQIQDGLEKWFWN